MKAKEYITQFNAAVAAGETTIDAARKVIADLMTESYAIALTRTGGKPQIYDHVIRPVLREQDLKWRSIAYALDWNPNGFRDLLREKGIVL